MGPYNNGLDYGIGDAVTYLGGFYYRTGNPNNPGYPPQPGSINASWTPVADAGSDATVTSGNIEAALGFTPIGDSPSDGSQYARKDGAWEVVAGGGGNPFDQSLNTTSSVGFEDVSVAVYEDGVRVPFRISAFLDSGNNDYCLTQTFGSQEPARIATREWVSAQGQVNSDWNATSGVAEILNKPSIPSFDQSLNTGDDVSFNSAFTQQLFAQGILRVGDTTDLGDDTFVLGRTQGTNLNGTALRIDHAWNNTVSGIPKALEVKVTGAASSADATLIEASFGGVRKFAVDKDGSLIAGSIPDARLSSNVALDNQNNSFTAGQSITAAANISALTASYSVTGTNTTPLLDLSGTWNTTGIANGIRLNITDTASNNSSVLIALQTGGTTRFSVNKFGNLFANELLAGTAFQARSNGVFIGGGQPIMWGAGAATGTMDTYLLRDGAANILAQRNGTAAQTKRIYNTYTDASNYERGFMQWSGNVLQIGTEAAGTGTANRSIFLKIGTQSGAAQFTAAGSGVDLNIRSVTVGAGIYSSALLLKNNGTTGWQARNNTDNAFRAIQGLITTDTAYTATTITPTGYLTIYDSTGTAYKVACSL